MEGASYCCFCKAVSSNFFQQILLINIISTYADLLKRFIFASFFVDRKKAMESVHYKRRRLLAAVLNTYFAKVLLINSINS